MADEQCVAMACEGQATEVGSQEPGIPAPVPVFLVPALDDTHQRQQVLGKVQEFLVVEYPKSVKTVTCVGQAGWEAAGQMYSLTAHLLSVCRAHQLLPSERCILLSQHDQYQAIQLCLARINKVRRGEFMAAASDVLDVWNDMYREMVEAGNTEAEHQEAEDETHTQAPLNHLRTGENSHDPARQEMEEVKKAYREFLCDSLCVDHFRVFECVRRLLKDNPTLFRKVFCKVYVVEGVEELPLMERALLKLISRDARVYRVATELPFASTTPLSPSALNISGIHENTIPQTPYRQDKQQEKQTEGKATDSRDTDIIQTASQAPRETDHDQKEMSSPGKGLSQVDGCVDVGTPGKLASREESNDSDKDGCSQEATQEEREECKNTHTPATQEENNDSKSLCRSTNAKMNEKEMDQNTITPATQEESHTSTNLCALKNTEIEVKEIDPNAHTPAKVSTQVETNHTNHKHFTTAMTIHLEPVEETLAEVIDKAPRYPARATVSSESEAYIERLFLAHVRLLINTRDELALTLACSMPGREITQQGFTDIRQEAQRKEMPMYQTIVSFILRQRLGGKGYQPEPNNPVRAHAKPLGEFVDALMKLQNTLEAQTDARQGAVRVICGIKTGLGKMRGCMLKRRVIEAVADRLCAALGHLVEAAERNKKASTDQGVSGSDTLSKLHPSLKHLIQLCDVAGGQAFSGGVVDALGGDLLSQLSSSKKGTKTPLRVPSVLSLFRSPAVIVEEEEEEEEDLEERIKRKMGQSETAPAQPKRYKSDCSWAPIDMSPIDADKLNLSFTSPIAGPTLMVTGKAAKRPSEDWREIVASVTQTEDSIPTPNTTISPTPKASSPARTKAQNSNKPKKSKSKRSLLKDISNMGTENEDNKTKGKKRLAAGEEGTKKRKEPKTKPLLKGQRPITSFFSR